MTNKECVLPRMIPKAFFEGPPMFSLYTINRSGTVFPILCDTAGRLQRTSVHEGIYTLMIFKKKITKPQTWL